MWKHVSLDEFKVCIYKTKVQSILEAWLINLETFTALLDKCAFIEESQISLYFAEYRNIYYTIRKEVMNIEIFIIPLDKCKVFIEESQFYWIWKYLL